MNLTRVNPAIWQLVRFQSTAKLRRMLRGFARPRRILWSVIAALLAAVWLSNATLSILLRESAGTERLQTWLPAGFLAYALWHFVKLVFQRPEEAIEWTPAERQILCGCPFSRHELIIYRIAGVSNAGLLKAALFTVLMSPDLKLVLAGFAGTFLVLLFLDLLRIGLEIAAFSISDGIYRWFRVATGLGIASLLAWTLFIAWTTPVTETLGPRQLSLGLMAHFLTSLVSLLETPLGLAAKAPFEVFGRVITASSYSWATLGWLALSIVMVAGAFLTLLRLDSFFDRIHRQRERQNYPPPSRVATAWAATGRTAPKIRIPWFGGAGPIAWRQLLGACRQSRTLGFALLLPGILACLPILIHSNGTIAVLNVAAGLVFYTYMLLPSALKLDFRRDIHRMIIFKALPLRPSAIVLGQLAAPVILTFGFQIIVLSITLMLRPYSASMLFTILLIMLPMNVLIYALDNFIYLLYPYRLNQEGIEIFLRTTLIFTAKFIILATVGAFIFGWSFAANSLSRLLLGAPEFSSLIFSMGTAVMFIAAAACTIRGLSRAFAQFDPSQDTPA